MNAVFSVLTFLVSVFGSAIVSNYLNGKTSEKIKKLESKLNLNQKNNEVRNNGLNVFWNNLINLKQKGEALWEENNATELNDRFVLFVTQLQTVTEDLERVSIYIGKEYTFIKALLYPFLKYSNGKLNLISFLKKIEEVKLRSTKIAHIESSLVDDYKIANKKYKDEYIESFDSIREKIANIIQS